MKKIVFIILLGLCFSPILAKADNSCVAVPGKNLDGFCAVALTQTKACPVELCTQNSATECVGKTDMTLDSVCSQIATCTLEASGNFCDTKENVAASADSSSASGKIDCSKGDVVCLENPLGKDRTDMRVILGEIINYVMGFIGAITLLVFVVGGGMWLTSMGNAEKVKTGTQAMIWAAVGLFIIFGSYAIINLIIKGLTGQ